MADWYGLACSTKTFHDCIEATKRTSIFNISLVPYMVYKTRKALVQAINRPTSSLYIQSIAREMLQVFNSHSGHGLDGGRSQDNGRYMRT
jgi:hypothetical protein